MELDKVLEFDQDNLTITVEATITNRELNKVLAPASLIFPTLNSNLDMTIGEQLANNYSLVRSSRFGEWTDNILGLEFRTNKGHLIKTGGKTFKNVSGYDVVPLVIGTKNTIGEITKVVLKLSPTPEAACIISCKLVSIEQGAAIKTAIKATDIEPTALTMVAENNAMTLQIELMGDEVTVAAQKEKAIKALTNYQIADTQDIYFASLGVNLPKTGLLISTAADQCVPILQELLTRLTDMGIAYKVTGDLYNHRIILDFANELESGSLEPIYSYLKDVDIYVDAINLQLPFQNTLWYDSSQLAIIDKLKNMLGETI
ncbi:MAG: FAD-binding oxidoreductase [Bacillota bacterium]|nr:FAD-binding oxidoreductase [Bacillota bacterium]